MKAISIKKIQILPIYLYFFISFFGIVLFFVYAFFIGHDAFCWIAMHHDPTLRFCDYFMHIQFCTEPEILYEKANKEMGCFPPFAYIIYFFLYKITSLKDVFPKNIEIADFNLFIFMYYSILSAVLFYYSIMLNKDKNKKFGFLFFLSLIFSVPCFMGGVERGNSMMIVFSLLMIFYNFYNNECSLKHKAIAIICLSICVCLKIYPGVFFLIYIKEKRYIELFIVLFLSCLMFFLPFCFFGGGNAFISWFNNVLSTMSHTYCGRIECIKGLIYTILDKFFNIKLQILTNISPYIFLVFNTILFFKSKNKFIELFLLCSIMTFFPTNAYRYTLCYLAIPLVCLTDDINVKKLRYYIFCMQYGLIFSIPTVLMCLIGVENKLYGFGGVTYVDIYMYTIAYIMLFFVYMLELKSKDEQTCK